jgi:hypothetical protein
VALAPQWRQNYPNKRPPSRATAISEMGQEPPIALQKKVGQGQTCDPDRDRLSTMEFKR